MSDFRFWILDFGLKHDMNPKIQNLKFNRETTDMALTIERPCVTPQEYLERERRAETKSEYSSGVITPMAGATKEHVVIRSDTHGHLWGQLQDGACGLYDNDMRTRVLRGDKYYYPDLIVVCGEAQFEDAIFDTLLNPTLIIEVLSGSTEHKDRNEKKDAYETLDSLTDYVLISQTETRIEHYSRLPDSKWGCVVASGRDKILPLPNIGCELRLAVVYRRVSFEAQTIGNQG